MSTEEKPFTFDFGDGNRVTAADMPEGQEKRMMEAIAETMGGFGVEGIAWENEVCAFPGDPNEYMIVNADSTDDEDGPHEVDVSLVPLYNSVDRSNKGEMEALVVVLNDHYDGVHAIMTRAEYDQLRAERS